MVRHQKVIAGLKPRQQRCCHRRQAGGDDVAACAAFHRGDRILQRPMRGRPTGAVGQHPLAASRRQRLALGDGRDQNGGPTQQWRIDEAVLPFCPSADMRQEGAEAARLARHRIVVSHAQPSSTGVSGRPPHSVQEPSYTAPSGHSGETQS